MIFTSPQLIWVHLAIISQNKNTELKQQLISPAISVALGNLKLVIWAVQIKMFQIKWLTCTRKSDNAEMLSAQGSTSQKGKWRGKASLPNFKACIISNVLASLDPEIKLLIHLTGYTTVTTLLHFMPCMFTRMILNITYRSVRHPEKVKHVAELSVGRWEQ